MFIYYILATLLPVDKIIGKIYPLFAIALLFMAVGILVMLFINQRRYLRLRMDLVIRIREACLFFRSCLLVSLVALSLAFMLPKVH